MSISDDGIKGFNPRSPIFVFTLCLIKFFNSSLVRFSRSPISNILSIKLNSNCNAVLAASLISATNSGVLNSGCSSISVLNNQQPALLCNDSSLTDHSTICPTPLSRFLILNDKRTAKELNKFTPSVKAEKIASDLALSCQLASPL